MLWEIHPGRVLGVEAEISQEKGADMQTLSAEIFESCGNFLIVEYYAFIFRRKLISCGYV